MKDDHSKFVTTRGVFVWNPKTERFETIEREGYDYIGPWSLAHTNASWEHANWRFRNDDGTLSTATWIKAEDTAVGALDGVAAGEKFRIRVNWGEDAAADSANVGSVKLQYNLGGAGWIDVPTTAGADGIAMASSDQAITDGDPDTTQRLAGSIPGSTFNSAFSEYDEDNSTTSRTWSDDFAEFEFCLALSAGTEDNVYQFRPVLSDGSADAAPPTYASLTVEAAPAVPPFPYHTFSRFRKAMRVLLTM